MAALNTAYKTLKEPTSRWDYDRKLGVDPDDARAARQQAAAAAAPVRVALASDPDPNAHCDFDFSGDSQPFRMAKGKASRVRGGRDGAKAARAQLRGKALMEWTERAGTLKHAGPLSP